MAPELKGPAEYRSLSRGFTSDPVSDWAEHRQCKTTGHNGLYARQAFTAGQVLCTFGCHALHDRASYLTLQVGEGKHIELSPVWLKNLNHACQPNVFLNTTTFTLEALADVAPGDELRFFYPSTEWHMDNPFDCKCGAACCLGRVSGAGALSRQQLRGHRLTDFIASKLNERDRGGPTGLRLE